MDVNGVSAIVSGGASGLGLATAKNLLERGARVTIFDLNEDLGEALASELNCSFLKVDVTDGQSVESALETVLLEHGDVRVLVNCAGVATGQKTTSKGIAHSLEDFERTVKINLVGTFNCVRVVANQMALQETVNGEERGVIVNTASVAAFDGQVGQAAYSASKGGVAAMTLPLARDLASHGIRVMTIAPGIFKTPMLAGLPPQVQDSLAASIPFPSRLADPDEYAALVLHICENAMLNGETIRLDGAIRLAPR